MTEDFVIKYFWSAIGYGLMSIPIFFPAIGNSVIPTQNASAGGEHDHIAARAEGTLYCPFRMGCQLI
jgi:ATP-binding cassette subfamily D (ALD) long-chain fatty acid import protein